MKNRPYFWQPASGLNADLERHQKERQKLLKEMEGSNDPIFKKAYKRFLWALEDSYAEIASRIGRRK